MSGNEFSVLAASRHSVRSFQDTQIAPEVLEAILEDARCAPSWSNTRPYKLALASGQQARRLGQAYQAEYDRALPMTHHHLPTILKLALSGKLPDGDYKPLKKYPAELLARSQEIGKGLYTHLGIARHDRQARDAYTRKNFNGFGAPTLGFVFIYRGLLPFSALDAGLMLQTLFLAAKSRGVDSCALGSLAIWRRPLDAEFEIDRDYKLITGFALGYASEDSINDFRAKRAPVELLRAKPRN